MASRRRNFIYVREIVLRVVAFLRWDNSGMDLFYADTGLTESFFV